jgi:hypothetical protein
MTRMEMVDFLIEDFKVTTPNCIKADLALLRRKLYCFNDDDLELLCEQVKKEVVT